MRRLGGLRLPLLAGAGLATGLAMLPATPPWAALAGIALLPILLQQGLAGIQGRRRRHLHDTLDACGIAAAEWRPERGDGEGSPLWQALAGPIAARRARPTQWLELAHPLDQERLLADFEGLLAPDGGDRLRASLRLPQADGQWRWYELQARVQQRRGGRVRRLLTTLADVERQHGAEERQRISVALFAHLHEGVLVTDLQLRVLDANPAYCRIMGLSREALLGQPAAPLLTTVLHRSGLRPEQLQQALQEQGVWQGRVSGERADRSPCVLQLTVATIPEPDGPLRYRVVTVSDLTEDTRRQQQLRQQQRFDALTGLANQQELMRLLTQALAASEREGFRIAICRLDLDQFKQINSRHGSEIGDELLHQVAQRLGAALRSAPQWSDVAARLGGDEFALLLRVADAEEAQRALERLLNVLRASYHLGPAGEPLSLELTASIGATLFPLDNSDAETLLRHAGHALYRAKHSGRNGLRFFDSAKRLRDEASLLALARMQQALDAGELRLFYQPKLDMQAGRVLGMEALLRWQHPERGLLPPSQFLPLIEQTGLAVQVGDWVIDQALKQSAQWLAQGLDLTVSVNVTARQLQMPDFAQRLQELINRHQEPVARHLSLEVLESAALADVAASNQLIQRCRAFGVRFALDDFGTGYSTLTYLKKLPVDMLKIDRSFVQNMLIDAQDMALVEGVIGLARHFGCSVIAEGVESAAHARALLRLGCQLGQGNGIAAAMPSAEVPGWIEAFSRSPWLLQLGGREQA
ncbi:putative bifunctional diguanylate cyclase/phosphodiesterase [Roseateles violae]|uniref:EAL domain-containing protein n=1 Tax=Roseateles violae TaxID=3058042 RepID=A0ABT8DZV7_9BURK|nr:GGDEF domain-containing phosphodiesterase [Pelomonas sp. PFR6]MDN3923080.1 EAL domain-containing protein [Pelomonas sp. PFR6]